MFTGDPGQPGLPGLPGAYTVQIPHRVQKRDTGKNHLNIRVKLSSATYMGVITTLFSFPLHPLQVIK